jgi:hypothetical protein
MSRTRWWTRHFMRFRSRGTHKVQPYTCARRAARSIHRERLRLRSTCGPHRAPRSLSPRVVIVPETRRRADRGRRQALRRATARSGAPPRGHHHPVVVEGEPGGVARPRSLNPAGVRVLSRSRSPQHEHDHLANQGGSNRCELSSSLSGPLAPRLSAQHLLDGVPGAQGCAPRTAEGCYLEDHSTRHWLWTQQEL